MIVLGDLKFPESFPITYKDKNRVIKDYWMAINWIKSFGFLGDDIKIEITNDDEVIILNNTKRYLVYMDNESAFAGRFTVKYNYPLFTRVDNLTFREEFDFDLIFRITSSLLDSSKQVSDSNILCDFEGLPIILEKIYKENALGSKPYNCLKLHYTHPYLNLGIKPPARTFKECLLLLLSSSKNISFKTALTQHPIWYKHLIINPSINDIKDFFPVNHKERSLVA